MIQFLPVLTVTDLNKRHLLKRRTGGSEQTSSISYQRQGDANAVTLPVYVFGKF